MRQKKILIVTDDAGESFEILHAQQRFREAGYQPVVASIEKRLLNAVIHDFYPGWNTYIEKPGYLVASDITFDDVDVTRVWTRRGPHGWTGRVGRVDADLLAQACFPPDERPHVYVCGPTPFVETVADLLVDLGHDPERIRTERFGPTGT